MPAGSNGLRCQQKIFWDDQVVAALVMTGLRRSKK
jgi:hypothetical protein